MTDVVPAGFDHVVTLIAEKMQGKLSNERAVELVNEIAREVWNARGAADIGKAEILDEAPAEMVVAAIRSLDRNG